MIRRLIARWRFQRTLNRNLAARKAARLSGRVYVAGYTRKSA